jgi:hypothetical protein
MKNSSDSIGSRKEHSCNYLKYVKMTSSLCTMPANSFERMCILNRNVFSNSCETKVFEAVNVYDVTPYILTERLFGEICCLLLLS